jgi:putative hydrolase of the HAD superfamily
MNQKYCEIIRRQSCPLEPLATGVSARLSQLSGVRAVLLDIYGTLFISGSGDIGTAAATARDDAVAAALTASGAPSEEVDKLMATQSAEGGLFGSVRSVIEEDHTSRRAAGAECPEVDIVEIWRKAIMRMSPPLGRAAVAGLDFRQVAIEYEVRVNPVWPMPDVASFLETLVAGGAILGIISNAQFYTPLLFPALLGRSLADLAFAEEMQYYSYRLGEAKPGEFMYRRAEAGLAERGVGAREILYVGNDMLNDIMPAARLGFRTALFAGDQRSLRLREGDSRVEQTTPDLVVTDLMQIARCAVNLP